MTPETTHQLRAIGLATLLALSVTLGSVAFTGGVTAASYGLDATDGAGGNSSFLFANVTNQLPEGEQSGTSNLTVRANSSLPETFTATLTLDEQSDVTFDTDEQNASDVEVVVFGEGGSPEDTENASVTSLDPKTVKIEANYSATNGFLGAEEESPPRGVNVTNLRFDTGAPENATLTWDIRGDTASYTLEVGTLPTEITAIDDQQGTGAAVTAGSNHDQMMGVSGGTSPRLNASDPSAFPSSYTATLDTEGTGITFNDSSTPTASSSYANAVVVSNNSTAITVSVFNHDASASMFEDSPYILQLDGVRYDVAPDADPDNITWHVLEASANYTLYPERLDAAFYDRHEFARGATQEPDDGVQLVVDARGKYTDGLQAGGENMTITIPDAAAADGLTFDTEASVSGEVDDGDPFSLDDPALTDVSVTATAIEFTVPEAVDDGEHVNVTGVRFNSTGYDARTDAGNLTIQSGLDVTYTPENASGTVDIATENESLHAEVPDVTVTGPSHLSTNETAQNTSVTVNITDTTGDQMADGEDIVIETTDPNLTFNTSQTIQVDAPSDQDFYVDSITNTGDSIVLHVNSFREPSTEGDWLNVSSASGGLLFDTSNMSTDANGSLAVTTSPGANDVTQRTDDVVTACQPVQSVISDDEGEISNANISWAIDLWREVNEVPGTCGETISNPQISYLIDVWREAGTVDEP